MCLAVYIQPPGLTRLQGMANCRALSLVRLFGQSDQVSSRRPLAQVANALFEQFNSGPPRRTPPQWIELIRFEPDGLSEADRDRSGPRHESSLLQNIMSTFDMRGHDWHARIDRKQPGTLFEWLDFAVTRACSFGIKNQIALCPL